MLVVYLDAFLLSNSIFKIRTRYKQYLPIIICFIVGIISDRFISGTWQDVIEILLPVILLGINLEDRKDFSKVSFATVIVVLSDGLVSLVAYLLIPGIRITLFSTDIDITKLLLEMPVFILIVIISLLIYKQKINVAKFQINRYALVYSLAGLSILASLSTSILYFFDLNVRLDRLIVVLIISTSLAVITLGLLVINIVRNNKLSYEVELSEKIIANQIEYFKVMEEKDGETKAFRHDIRKHLFCMKHLSEAKEYDELDEYIKDICDDVEELSPEINTGNSLISSILAECIRQRPNVVAKWEGHMPQNMGISNIDLCTIFYNLIQNAFEAGDRYIKTLSENERREDIKKLDVDVYIEMSITNMNKILIIKNKRVNMPIKGKKGYISSKNEKGHGFGLKNVMAALENIDASIITEDDGYLYTTEVIIPNFTGIK